MFGDNNNSDVNGSGVGGQSRLAPKGIEMYDTSSLGYANTELADVLTLGNPLEVTQTQTNEMAKRAGKLKATAATVAEMIKQRTDAAKSINAIHSSVAGFAQQKAAAVAKNKQTTAKLIEAWELIGLKDGIVDARDQGFSEKLSAVSSSVSW
jgi:hypothetical protein